VSGNGSTFDRFAQWASDFASHATFFAACVLLVLVWAPSYFLFGSLDTWQLVINTATTIVTFILVALLQNTQRRSDDGMHAKLDAIADALADLMTHVDTGDRQLTEDVAELRRSVGAEKPEGSA
jgi:low affinity Fe/Cu permease